MCNNDLSGVTAENWSQPHKAPVDCQYLCMRGPGARLSITADWSFLNIYQQTVQTNSYQFNLDCRFLLDLTLLVTLQFTVAVSFTALTAWVTSQTTWHALHFQCSFLRHIRVLSFLCGCWVACLAWDKRKSHQNTVKRRWIPQKRLL